MDFKVGNGVQLKGSPSPIMTITALGKDWEGATQATCRWHDNAGIERTAVYPVEALRLYTGEKGEDREDGNFGNG
jgi:uncharacterized protein YodC (DUF2158 family)